MQDTWSETNKPEHLWRGTRADVTAQVREAVGLTSTVSLDDCSVFVKDWLLEDKDKDKDKDLGSEDKDKDLRSDDEDKELDLGSEDEDKDSNFKCWSTC